MVECLCSEDPTVASWGEGGIYPDSALGGSKRLQKMWRSGVSAAG
jgi:hypothetical protein